MTRARHAAIAKAAQRARIREAANGHRTTMEVCAILDMLPNTLRWHIREMRAEGIAVVFPGSDPANRAPSEAAQRAAAERAARRAERDQPSQGRKDWEPHEQRLRAAYEAGRSFLTVADELGLQRGVVDRLWRRWRADDGVVPYARHYITAGLYSVACDPEHAPREREAAERHGPVVEIVRWFELRGQTIREVRG